MLLYLVLVGGPTFGVLYQAWRAWDFAHWWLAAEAVTVGSDYSDAERVADSGWFAWLKPRPWSDANGDRRTKVRIAFTDDRGVCHRAQVTRMIRRGSMTMPAMNIFFDSRDPDRVDVYGSTGALILMTFWGLALVVVLYRMAMVGSLSI